MYLYLRWFGILYMNIVKWIKGLFVIDSHTTPKENLSKLISNEKFIREYHRRSYINNHDINKCSFEVWYFLNE